MCCNGKQPAFRRKHQSTSRSTRIIFVRRRRFKQRTKRRRRMILFLLSFLCMYFQFFGEGTIHTQKGEKNDGDADCKSECMLTVCEIALPFLPNTAHARIHTHRKKKKKKKKPTHVIIIHTHFSTLRADITRTHTYISHHPKKNMLMKNDQQIGRARSIH